MLSAAPHSALPQGSIPGPGIHPPPPEQPWEVGESSVRQGQQLLGEEARMAHCKMPTAAASSHMKGSCQNPLPWRGRETCSAPRPQHKTHHKEGLINSSQPLENRCSSSSSPLPYFLPPQGLSAAEPLSGGGPAASLKWFHKPGSLQQQLCHCVPRAAGSCWGQPGTPCCWFFSQEQRDELQLSRGKKFSFPQPYLGSSQREAPTAFGGCLWHQAAAERSAKPR